MATPFLEGDVEALCAEDSIYGLIIANVYGAREPGDPDLEWEEGGAVEIVKSIYAKNTPNPKKIATFGFCAFSDSTRSTEQHIKS